MTKHNRILEHPILGKLEERTPISFTFDGKEYEGYAGDTIASALLAHDIRTLRVQEEAGTPRGIYCNIGHCFECRVTVDNVTGVRACLVEIKADIVVESGQIQPTPLKKERETDDFPRTYAEYTKKTIRGREVKAHD